jgi:DNA (cytosine-5)-methyltransferase 1
MNALVNAQYAEQSYWQEHGISAKPTPTSLRPAVSRLSKCPLPATQRWRTVRDALADLPEPIEYKPTPLWDSHVGIPDARQYPGHTGSGPDWPAKTLKAGDHGNPGGENMLHREDGTVRYFTVREMARLQTFPDSWLFASSWTENRRQLGNAVPVEMARILGLRIFARLSKHQPPAQLLQRTQTSLE